MVGVLIAMKLRLLRRSLVGARGAWVGVGTVAGVVLAVGTLVLSAWTGLSQTIVADLLGVAFAVWMFGWIVGPVWGGTPVLRVEHFELVPIPRRRLAVGLLGAAFVGITTAVTLLAFLSLVIYAARLGWVPALVAVPGVVLQLVLVVLLSRVVVAGFGAIARGRVGAAVTGLMLAALLVLTQFGWMLVIALQYWQASASGMPSAFSTVVRSLPSGWALVAVESADNGHWLRVIGVLSGLIVLNGLLLLVWS